ncbi:hypothetical protein WJX75_001146 [Coccomyxa subellipsoidea]|uniref:Protein kinase domain-containing protein n=1 Tax=Coccomyxa subellipsoidea TaxID=248742 RepID=A0ABR2YDH8_9CHLO
METASMRSAGQAETSGRPFYQTHDPVNSAYIKSRSRQSPLARHFLRAPHDAVSRLAQRRASPILAAAASQSATGLGDWFFTESGQKDWVEAMELRTLTPDMPALLAEMGVSYNPDKLAEALKGREVEISARGVKVATTFAGCLGNILKDYALGQLEQNSKLRARQLCNALQSLGPSFVKIGQALSSRPDLLPQIYLETLAELQDRLQPFPTEIALQLIEEELGETASAILSEITPEPVAAASLGQVYRGRLRSTGEEVALKVQRPGIGETIAIDMVLLRRLMTAFDASLPRLNLPLQLQPLTPLVDEFASRLFGELDYVQEGLSAEKFQDLYGSVPRIRTPRIVWAHTARRVLCMEWVDGVKLTDKAAMAAAGLDIIDFVDVGIECTLRQLLEHGYFHADPHPGNLLATRAGDLCYLDFGMMSEAPQNARYAIIAHVVHLVNRDYQAMCRDYYTLEFMDRSVDTSPIAPALAAFFDNVLDRSVAQLNFKAIVDGLGGVLFRFPFRVPAYYALILRSLTVLEGLALQADADYKLLGKAYPYMARRLLTDPAPELRGSFEELVLEGGRVRWSRVENLVVESAKSSGFDPAQLWMVVDWVLGAPGAGIRKPLAAEVARLVDSAVAEEVRGRVLAQTGDAALVERLAPMQPGEAEAARRARLLYNQLSSALGVPPASLPQGTGPFGMPGLDGVQAFVRQLQAQAARVWPQVRGMADTPGAVELRAELVAALSRRFVARTIKLIFGPQKQQAAKASPFTAPSPRASALQNAAVVPGPAVPYSAPASLNANSYPSATTPSATATTIQPPATARPTRSGVSTPVQPASTNNIGSRGKSAADRQPAAAKVAAARADRGSDSALTGAAPPVVAASSIPAAAGGVAVTKQRMINLAALGETPAPAITEAATPVQVEVVESTTFD